MRNGSHRAVGRDDDPADAPPVVAWGNLTVFVVVLVAYALLARSAYDLFGALDIGVTFFPPAGLTFTAFAVLPHRRWLAIALAIVLAEIAVDMERGNGFLWSAGWAAANLAEPLAGALLARRLTPRFDLGRRSAAAVVTGGLVVGPALGASIGATTLAVADDLAWWSAFVDVWVGDALGVLVVAPAVLLFLRPPASGWRALAIRTLHDPDAWLLLGTLAAMAIVLPNVDDLAVGYAVIPLLAWPATRMGPRALAIAALTLASVTTAATAHGRGPWAGVDDADTLAQLGQQQLFLLVAIGGAWLLALEVRERTRAVALARSVASDAALLSRALHAGQMGVWTWDRSAEEVRWDPHLERLYGVEPGSFDGSFATWMALVHPDDRDRVTAELTAGMQSGDAWRVAHRCIWPDGTVHWIEGMGELALDADGAVVGAFGIGADIDDRRRADNELARLFDIERTGRQRADLQARVHSAVGYSLDLEQLVDRITAAAVPAFGEWCSLVLTLDQPDAEPLMATAHVDPTQAAAAARYQIERHRVPEGPAHVAEVRRTGATLFIPVIDDDMIAGIDASQRALIEGLDLRSTIIVALPSQLGVLGVLELVRTSVSPPYTATDVELAEDLARTIGAALNSALLYRRQLRARRALDTLQALTGRLAVALSSDEIVRTVVDHGASSLAADSAMVYLLGADDSLQLAAHTGLAHDRVGRWQAIESASHGPLADAVRRRTTVVLRSRADILAQYPDMADPPDGETSLVALPLVIRNSSFGGLVFTFDRRRDFADEDLAMLETLAGRCAGALERARLYDEQRDASLTLQRRLLPALPTLPPWLDAGAMYRPTTGGEVGGDWYQVLVVDVDRCVAVLGDAVGRGIGAAAAMGQLRAVVTGAAHVDPDPAVVLAATDEFATDGADTRCTSLAYALIDRRGDSLRYACAGHPPPVLVRAADDDAVLLTDGRSPLLGTGALKSPPAVADLTFSAGDTIVLYSDGLVERRGEAIDDGIERLRAAVGRLRHQPPAEMGVQLLQTLIGESDVNDDVAVLVLRRH